MCRHRGYFAPGSGGDGPEHGEISGAGAAARAARAAKAGDGFCGGKRLAHLQGAGVWRNGLSAVSLAEALLEPLPKSFRPHVPFAILWKSWCGLRRPVFPTACHHGDGGEEASVAGEVSGDVVALEIAAVGEVLVHGGVE